MNTWFKQLGYYENPFLINPAKEQTPLFGQEKQLTDAVYYVQSGSIIFVEGEMGSGKTKFLFEIIKNFRGRIIYVNAAKLTKTLDIEQLLRKRNGLKGRVFNQKPKDMVLLLDNADELSLVNLERLKYYFDQSYLQSIVFTGKSFKKVGFPASLAQRIGKRIIKLAHLTESQAIDLAYARLEEDENNTEPLISKAMIKKVYAESKKNPQQFLINLHRVFEEMHFQDAETVDEEHVNILQEKLDEQDLEELYRVLGVEIIKKEEQFTDHGHSIMKIGEYYRSPDLDMFCGNCGAIVTEEDTSCPECAASFEGAAEQKEEKTTGEANA